MGETLHRPHFVIIGAMKCATSTLHDQLGRQPGVFMSEPKEPNFFSDDEQWARGLGWYRSLFASAPEGAVCGESSTHYTKLPTHPLAAERLAAHMPEARLIYVMRDPVDRIVSQYIHEWSVRKVTCPIDEAVRTHPALIDYSRYAMQLGPWLDRFGPSRVLPVFFERLTASPQSEFDRVCRFIGIGHNAVWHEDMEARNVSAQRVRRKPVLDRFLGFPPVRVLRRTLLPEAMRERIKRRWRMEQRPQLSTESLEWCREQLDPDMDKLGRLLGVDLSSETFRSTVLGAMAAPEWSAVGAPR